jgi:hypothetical protein
MYCDAFAFILQVAYFIAKKTTARKRKMSSGKYRIE